MPAAYAGACRRSMAGGRRPMPPAPSRASAAEQGRDGRAVAQHIDIGANLPPRRAEAVVGTKTGTEGHSGVVGRRGRLAGESESFSGNRNSSAVPVASFYHLPRQGERAHGRLAVQVRPRKDAGNRHKPAAVASTPCAIGAPLAGVAGREAVWGQPGRRGLKRRPGGRPFTA
jgi:hypothetical protein